MARILADSVVTEGQVRDITTNGIQGGDRCRVHRCLVYFTGGAGVDLGETSRVLNCDVLGTTGNGMTLAEGSSASHNTVDGDSTDANVSGERSAGYGIYGTRGVRITDNTIVDYTTGTRVSTAGFVVRNFFNNNGTNSTGSGGTAAPEQSIATATNPVANIDY